MLFNNRKGTEKPIEIFVALFVILAVALVMLKLFQNQITQKQGELETFQQERKQIELREKATLYCKNQCVEASNDGCSLRRLASLCLAYGSDAVSAPDFLDLNSDGIKGEDRTLLPGTKVCEDAVPCSTMISECCGTPISPTTCKTILTDFWTQEGFTDAQITSLMRQNLPTGTACSVDASHWYNRSGYP